MRLMLCSFSTQSLVKVAYKLHEQKFNIVYWIGHEKYFEGASQDKDFFPSTIFHNGLDAIRALPAPAIDESEFMPVDKDLTEKMKEFELQILSMMDCVDYTNLPLSQKKDIYYKYLRYWFGILKSARPDAVLFHDIPHIPHNFVIYCLSKILGIKTIMYTGLKNVPDRVIFFEDFKEYKELSAEYEEIKKGDSKIEDLPSDFQEYLKKQFVDKINFVPRTTDVSMIEKQLRRSRILPSFSSIVSHLLRGNILKTAYYYFRHFFVIKKLPTLDGLQYRGLIFRLKVKLWERMRNNFKKEYDSLTVAPDYSKKFVYVALQVQPERTTSAEGDIFSDQILMLRILSWSIPTDWVIYVKEHPFQWLSTRSHLGRYKGFYEDMAKMRNIKLISSEVSTFELIHKSQAVATVTGSVSWEAILHGKPALLFGFTWNQYCHGTFRIATVSDCQSALELISNGFKPNFMKIIQFFLALDKVSIYAHDRHCFNKKDPISCEENINQVVKGFCRLLLEEKGNKQQTVV